MDRAPDETQTGREAVIYALLLLGEWLLVAAVAVVALVERTVWAVRTAIRAVRGVVRGMSARVRPPVQA